MYIVRNGGQINKEGGMNIIITFMLSLVFAMAVITCTPSVIVEIEPGESVELVIVEPKTETPKERWDWRSREKVRKEKKEVSKTTEECCTECCEKSRKEDKK